MNVGEVSHYMWILRFKKKTFSISCQALVYAVRGIATIHFLPVSQYARKYRKFIYKLSTLGNHLLESCFSSAARICFSHTHFSPLPRHTVVCQRPRETQNAQCAIYRKRKVADFNPLYLLNYLEDFYQIYIFYALHIHDLT